MQYRSCQFLRPSKIFFREHDQYIVVAADILRRKYIAAPRVIQGFAPLLYIFGLTKHIFMDCDRQTCGQLLYGREKIGFFTFGVKRSRPSSSQQFFRKPHPCGFDLLRVCLPNDCLAYPASPVSSSAKAAKDAARFSASFSGTSTYVPDSGSRRSFTKVRIIRTTSS